MFSDEIDEYRELWISGLVGIGKIVVVVEFMGKFRSFDRSFIFVNILYVCERFEMLLKIRYV